MSDAIHPGNSSAPLVSVVVIGRNEGERLVRCLESVRQANWDGRPYEVVYVDSRSTDASVGRAESLGARAFVLSDASPCAAKARNLGWTRARGEFILFLDGDTQLDPDFVARALQTLEDPVLCAAWGHRRESDPGQSIYTRVLDLDWVYPVGRTQYFGGDVLVRRTALASVDGFDPTLKAGEEPEMCARLRAAGWQIEHIDAPMTRHDLAVNTLRAYWLRAYRSGIAYAEVADRMKRRNDPMWQREALRDFVHGILLIALPFVFLLTLFCSLWLTALLCAAVGAVLYRTVLRCRWKAPEDPVLCWEYAVHAYLQKVPAVHGTGNIHFGRNAMFYPGVYLETQGEGRIEIGDDVVFSSGVHIVAFDRVTIGRGVMIGEYTSLRDANHNPDPVSVRRSGHTCAPIEVGDNAWIGRGACVLKGVRLGANCIVAANAVVTRDVGAGTLVAGIPARPLPQRNA